MQYEKSYKYEMLSIILQYKLNNNLHGVITLIVEYQNYLKIHIFDRRPINKTFLLAETIKTMKG